MSGRVLTAADPEPAAGSVVLDRVGDAWQGWGDGNWRCVKDVGPWDWAEMVAEYGPVTLIHDGGAS